MYNPIVSNSVTAAEITALSPHLWISYENDTYLNPAYNVGTSIISVVSQGTPGLTINASSAGLHYDTIGNAKSLLSTVSWHYLAGTHPDPQTATCSFTTMFETKSTVNSTYWILKSPVFRFKVAGAVIAIVENNTVHPTSLVVQPSTPYILQCDWDGSGMAMALIKLTDMSSQAFTQAMPNNLAPTSTTLYNISNAQSGWIGAKIGEMIELNAPTAAQNTTVINYMKQLYSGTAPPSSGSIPHSLKIHSDFFSGARVGKSIQKKAEASTAIDTLLYKQTVDSKGLFTSLDGIAYECETAIQLDKVDLEFRDPQDNLVDVSDYTITMDVFNNISQL